MKKKMNSVVFRSLLVVAALSLSACSNWIYRIDIPQGNFLEQKDINKLRVQMTKEQVRFVLGNPVAENAFDDHIWHYFYALKGGRGTNFEKQLVATFDNEGHLLDISGDFEKPANFNTPLDI